MDYIDTLIFPKSNSLNGEKKLLTVVNISVKNPVQRFLLQYNIVYSYILYNIFCEFVMSYYEVISQNKFLKNLLIYFSKMFKYIL